MTVVEHAGANAAEADPGEQAGPARERFHVFLGPQTLALWRRVQPTFYEVVGVSPKLVWRQSHGFLTVAERSVGLWARQADGAPVLADRQLAILFAALNHLWGASSNGFLPTAPSEFRLGTDSKGQTVPGTLIVGYSGRSGAASPGFEIESKYATPFETVTFRFSQMTPSRTSQFLQSVRLPQTDISYLAGPEVPGPSRGILISDTVQAFSVSPFGTVTSLPLVETITKPPPLNRWEGLQRWFGVRAWPLILCCSALGLTFAILLDFRAQRRRGH